MCQYANMFTETIIEWYKENKRDLPWRDSSDPYLIWISEIILQQTRVAQGYDYFLRFIGRFPDVSTLVPQPAFEAPFAVPVSNPSSSRKSR